MMEKDLFKFIKRILLFIPLAAVGYIVLLCIWGQFVPGAIKSNLNYKIGGYGYLNRRLKEADTTKNVDILFLGSSHAYRGFDNRIFEKEGYTCFNLGSSSQTPRQTLFLIEKYLPKLNPKIVVFEIYPAILSNDGVESSLDIIANSKMDEQTVEMARDVAHLKIFNALLYDCYRESFNLNETVTDEDDGNGMDTYVKGGYVERKITYYKPVTYPGRSILPMDNDQLEALRHGIDLINASGAKLILLQTPIPASVYETYGNAAEIDRVLAGYGQYYNFNEIQIGLTDSLHFYDSSHLNQHGVEIFNRELLEKLKETDFTPKK